MRFAVLLQHQHRVKKLYPVFLRTAGPAVAVQCISSTKGPVRVHEEGHPSSSFGGMALEDLQRWVFFLHPKNNFSYGTLCATHHGLPPLIKKFFFFFFLNIIKEMCMLDGKVYAWVRDTPKVGMLGYYCLVWILRPLKSSLV